MTFESNAADLYAKYSDKELMSAFHQLDGLDRLKSGMGCQMSKINRVHFAAVKNEMEKRGLHDAKQK